MTKTSTEVTDMEASAGAPATSARASRAAGANGDRNDSPTILIDELAPMLGHPGPAGILWLKGNHYRLTEGHGFPRRLCTGWAWPRALVEIWILSGGHLPPVERGKGGAGTDSPAATGAANDDPLDLVERQRAFLRKRIGAR